MLTAGAETILAPTAAPPTDIDRTAAKTRPRDLDEEKLKVEHRVLDGGFRVLEREAIAAAEENEVAAAIRGRLGRSDKEKEKRVL